MPGSGKHDARIRESIERIKARGSARSVESGQTEPSGTGRDIANGQPDRDQVAPVGPVLNPSGFSSGDRDGNQIPVATPTRPFITKQNEIVIPKSISDKFPADQQAALERFTEQSRRELWARHGYQYEPHYAKPRPLIGWIAQRIGKRLRPKEKKTVEPLTPKDLTDLNQAKKFNASTANLKGIIAAVAVVTSVAGGLLGKQILIDQDTITVAVTNIYQAYMGVLAVIAAITYVLRILKNVKSNWHRIKEHGVKVSGPNADLGFDFAPKGDE